MIRNETDMKKVLRLLIFELRTLDGVRDSANNLLDLMNKQSIAEYRKLLGRNVLSSAQEQKLMR